MADDALCHAPGEWLKERIARSLDSFAKAAVERERERCAYIVSTEPELPGEPTPLTLAAIQEDIVAGLRATVRATKLNIVGRIRSGEQP